MDNRAELQALFNNPPYAYQERVCAELLAGRNAILRAPTGAGKTEAALGPYLLARQRGDVDFPRRCILASPMRTLAKDLYGRAQTSAARIKLPEGESPLIVKLHTGEDPAAPLLEGDIIVTTVDQLLSNYLHVPYSVSSRSRNIGAGGVVSSYVVLDEFHLFDPRRAFRTALSMARALIGVTPFVFMTATFSEELTQNLAGEVGATVITPTATELRTMQSQRKTRSFQRVETPLTAQAVVEAHLKRSVAIANTVDRVQTLFTELKRLQDGDTLQEGEGALHHKLQGVTLEMLHSRYFPTHRNEREDRLSMLLGKGSTANVILVASQAIEVGLNISSEQLHTEICPANSLLQRAGRNARFEGECGVVSVYALPSDEKGRWKILPYKGQNEIIRATWEAVAVLPAPIDAAAEKALIDAVHTPGDAENWRGYERERQIPHGQNMGRAFAGETAMRAELIRDIQNVSVLLHDQDTDLRTWTGVNRFERLSVTWINFAALEANREAVIPDPDSQMDWLAKVPREVEREKKKTGPDDSRQPTLLEWIPIISSAQLQNEPLVLINPRFVFYNRQEGFRWTAPEGVQPGIAEADFPPVHPGRDSGERSDYWYVYETYEEHIENVLKASQRVAKEVWHICPKVDRKFDLPAGTVALALKAAIAGHDIGKLSVGWQGWTRGWQAEQVNEYGADALWGGAIGTQTAKVQVAGEYCAHTDYHPKFDKGRNRDFDRKGRRPPHAGESAAVLIPAIEDYFFELLSKEQAIQIIHAISGAICRHHSASAIGETQAWRLDAEAGAEAARVFQYLAGALPLNLEVIERMQKNGIPANFDPDLPSPKKPLGWLVYTLASRALRLGDTNSFDRQGGPS